MALGEPRTVRCSSPTFYATGSAQPGSQRVVVDWRRARMVLRSMRDDTVDIAEAAEATAAAAAPVGWAKWDLLLLAGIALLGAIVRLLAIEQWSFDAVEADTYRALTLPGSGQQGFFSSDESRYPLVFLGVRWLLDTGLLPGFTEGWIRLPFAFAGSLLAPLMALYCRPLLGRGVACLAALVVAVHPAHLAASQTADPLVVAVSVAMFAGIAAARGWRFWTVAMIVLAAACHWLGGLLGLGLLAVALESHGRLPRLPSWSWWLVAAPVVAMLPALLDTLSLSMAILVVLALGLRVPLAAGVSLAIALPLVVPAVCYWLANPVTGEHACLVALPGAIMLSSWVAVRFYRTLTLACPALVPTAAAPRAELGAPERTPEPEPEPEPQPGPKPISLIRPKRRSEAKPRKRAGLVQAGALLGTSSVEAGEREPSWLRRALAGAPTMLLVGELATGAFLYFTVFAGGRAPWRDVRDVALTRSIAGQDLHVVGGTGAEVLRVYLRPSHWRRPGGDAHPGVRVTQLSIDDGRIAAAEMPAVAEWLSSPNALLALRREEWLSLQAMPELAEVLTDYRILSMWPCPNLRGDESLYLLQRELPN